MKVLFLCRQQSGGLGKHARLLASDLGALGVEIQVENAESWIPNETGKKIDRRVSERLRSLAGGCDLVHAFGYRAAWACAEAFGGRESWVYTAYDLPKTTHHELTSRLDQAQIGFATSEAVRRILRESLVDEVRVVTPGVEPLASTETREVTRERLGIPEEASVLGAFGRFAPERGFASLLEALDQAWGRLPDIHLILAGEGPLRDDLAGMITALDRKDQVHLLGWDSEIGNLVGAVDLVVVPSRTQGFSMIGAEAMNMGQTVLLRRVGGLPEMIDERISGFLFDNDDHLGDTMAGLLQSPMTLGVVGNAARVRAEDRFDRSDCADAIFEAYKELVLG